MPLFTTLALAAGLAAAAELTIPSDAGAPIGNCDLGATLEMPAGAKALVVFVHGSGTQNRDEGLPQGIAPFRDIANALSARGIGSLRFDKRGVSPSCRAGIMDPADPNRSHPALQPATYIADIETVYRRAVAESGGLPVFVLAHSEGVNYALELVAGRRIDPAGLILLAGLGKHPIDVTLLRQLREVLARIDAALADPKLPPEQRAELVAQRPGFEKALREGETFFQEIGAGRSAASDYYLGAYEPYWKEWIAITARAATTAAAAAKPSLLIQGDADQNVSKDDFDALAAALKPHGGESKLFAGLDHLFLSPGSSTVSSAATDSISDWIERRVSPAALPAAPAPLKLSPSRALLQLKGWLR